LNKITNVLKSVIGGIFSLLFIILIIIVWSANIKSCFTFGYSKDKSGLTNEREILEASDNNENHKKIIGRMTKIYIALGLGGEDTFEAYFVNNEDELNAASYGDGVYLFWETLVYLPDDALDSVLSHELAHDLLYHNRNMEEVDDVRSFFTEAFSLIFGGDRAAEKTLQDWSSNITMPQYSKPLEYEADKKAVIILSQLGYNKPAKTYSDMLKLLKELFGNTGGGFFDYHPSTDERIQNVLSLK
jgi:Zn-dependent protease with chaperone function